MPIIVRFPESAAKPINSQPQARNYSLKKRGKPVAQAVTATEDQSQLSWYQEFQDKTSAC